MADTPKAPVPAPVASPATKTAPATPKSDASTPPGVHNENAPSKPVTPTTEEQKVLDANKKPNVEVAGVNSANNPAATTDKSTDTPEKDPGKGGEVATTGNQSMGKVAEPGTPNTLNPPKTALEADGGRATPSEHETTSSPSSTHKDGEPFPPDATPTPSASELDRLDENHGYSKPVEAVTDNDDEKASLRKFVEMARALPSTTPDGGIFGGYGGIRITYGDIRNIARVSQRSSDE